MAASVPPGSCAARIMLFTGGPCTEGMGKIINKDLAEEIRRYSSSSGSSRMAVPAAAVGQDRVCVSCKYSSSGGVSSRCRARKQARRQVAAAAVYLARASGTVWRQQ